jgi:archaellum component FlaF (FlaF/FlaG flagellin family)
VNFRTLFISILISIGLLYVACGQSPDKSAKKVGSATEKRSVEQKKTVRVKHLSGEVIAINSKTKTITVRFKDEDIDLKFDEGTVVKIDLDSVKPSEIPLGSHASVKYVEKKGQHVARGIFISTETAGKKEGSPQSFFRNSARHDHRGTENSIPSGA